MRVVPRLEDLCRIWSLWALQIDQQGCLWWLDPTLRRNDWEWNKDYKQGRDTETGGWEGPDLSGGGDQTRPGSQAHASKGATGSIRQGQIPHTVIIRKKRTKGWATPAWTMTTHQWPTISKQAERHLRKWCKSWTTGIDQTFLKLQKSGDRSGENKT